MSRTNKRYGWIPDLPDQRDFLFASPYAASIALPSSVDLRSVCPPVYDQGQLGSCTANAIAAALEFDQIKQNLTPIFVPSRLFIYYNERSMEGTVNSDSGAQIRDGIKTVSSQGACSESEWSYDITKFAVQPPPNCYSDAPQNRAINYQRLSHNLQLMRGCLASGYPFVFGMTVYESFESQAVAQSGQVPMPAPKEQTVGGHAVLAVGYDDTKQVFLVRNSWGSAWGMQGYFTLPYAYLSATNLTNDMWTIRTVQ